MINKKKSKLKNIDNSDKQVVSLFGEIEKSSTKSKRPVKKEPRIDPRNKLNNLNGAEWQYWTKTVLNKQYPSNLQHKLRSQHGGQKPPML